LRIRDEVGCRLQEGVQLCNSAWRKRNFFKKIWTQEIVDRARNSPLPE
jgi:hypothetical protein